MASKGLSPQWLYVDELLWTALTLNVWLIIAKTTVLSVIRASNLSGTFNSVNHQKSGVNIKDRQRLIYGSTGFTSLNE
tara:strand:- start:216 stop:449 length:234 start_codon:yes stop_codon:yes gene_type:complete